MENGRIVYNRQYGKIPKGSYSGSTYTVKKGDTLFYIAWITGNDFRDLAQRNNIQAPIRAERRSDLTQGKRSVRQSLAEMPLPRPTQQSKEL